MKIKNISEVTVENIDSLRIVGTSADEQETIITIPRNGEVTVSCYDNTMLTKMKRLFKSGVAKLVSVSEPSEDHEFGEITEAFFTMPKKALSFRQKIESTMSEEQRAAASERMKALQLKRKSK